MKMFIYLFIFCLEAILGGTQGLFWLYKTPSGAQAIIYGAGDQVQSSLFAKQMLYLLFYFSSLILIFNSIIQKHCFLHFIGDNNASSKRTS